MLQEPAEPFAALDLALRKWEDRRLVGIGNLERHVASALMWPFFVIMDEVFFHEMLQVPLATDNEVIEAFLLKSLDEPLGEGGLIGRSER